MGFHFVLASVFFLNLLVGAATKGQKILRGKKTQISCPDSLSSHIFCEVDVYDTPGICGHGFECVIMKSGEKKIICDTEFSCEDAPRSNIGQ